MDFIYKELLDHMKKARCHQVMYGIEYGNPEIRRKFNKNINIDFKKIIKMTQKAGIQIRATYMIGDYEEKYEDVLETIKFAKYLNSEIAVFNVCTPFPGTKLYKRLEAEGRILTKNWDKYDFFNVVFRHPNLSGEDIASLYKKANKEFYLRPIVFLRQANCFFSFSRLMALFRIVVALARGVINRR